MPISDKTIDLISKSLDLRLKDQGVIASNIANADTPNYKSMKMDFESKLQEAADSDDLRLDATNEKHMDLSDIDASGADDVFEDPDATVKNDGNSVNRERELVKLAQEQQLYNANVSTLNKKLAMLKYAITEGGNR